MGGLDRFGGPAAVHQQRRAGHHGGGVGGEQHDRSHDLFHPAEPAEVVGHTPDGIAIAPGTGDNMGAALGIAVSGLPGMSLAPAVAAGIGGTCAAMLRLPLTSTLLATLLLGSDGVAVTPQVVVAVVVAFVITMVLPEPGPQEHPVSSAPP